MIQARVVLPCTSNTCLFILSGVQREVNHFICSHEVRRWDVLFADAFPVQMRGILKGTPVEVLCTSSTGLFHAWCRQRTKVWELPSAMSRHASVPKNIDYVDRSLEKNQLKTQINQWRNELTIPHCVPDYKWNVHVSKTFSLPTVPGLITPAFIYRLHMNQVYLYDQWPLAWSCHWPILSSSSGHHDVTIWWSLKWSLFCWSTVSEWRSSPVERCWLQHKIFSFLFF